MWLMASQRLERPSSSSPFPIVRRGVSSMEQSVTPHRVVPSSLRLQADLKSSVKPALNSTVVNYCVGRELVDRALTRLWH
ncbi:hypothetical protein CDL15_Pgr010839 [Punica granatum]|nr:hypothetical protein CDL15_Pgr010839 [Punica granatum]